MDLELTGKIALVTGASSGIGAACAQMLGAEGADVVLTYRHDAGGAERAAAEVRARGRRAWVLQMDVADDASVSVTAASIASTVPGLDVLVQSAGENIVTPLDDLAPPEWDHVVRVNLSGTYYVLHHVRPLLRPGASVVLIASVAASTGAPHHAHYAAAKAGVVNLAKSAARAFAPGVRVNCVSPGITLTPMGERTARSLGPDYARQKLLAGRYATPDEIARTVVFLASPAASFVYGATLDVNGGRDLR